MRTYLILLLHLAAGCAAQAQPTSARAASLGGATTAMLDASDLASNPAAWSVGRKLTLALSAAQLYGMPELRSASAQVLVPVAGFALVGGASMFGFDLYRETGFVFGVARAVRPGTHRSVHVGLRLRQTVVRIPGYAGASIPTLSAGFIIPVLPSVALGAHAENVVVFSNAPESQRALALGLRFAHGAHMLVVSDVVKELRSPTTVRLGVEAQPTRVLALRAGLTTEPPRASGGIGIRSGPLAIDAAAEHHYALGWTPVLSVAVTW